MTVETASTIAELNANAPAGTEPVAQGNDHIQLIKGVLQTQFTGGSSGLASPVTVTAGEMNALAGSGIDGVTIQLQLQFIISSLNTTIRAPAGTRILLTSGAALPLWKRMGSIPGQTGRPDDAFLRMVNIPPGTSFNSGSGGAQSASFGYSSQHNHSGTLNTTLTTAQLPQHSHSINDHDHFMFKNTQSQSQIAGGNFAAFQSFSGSSSDAYTMRGLNSGVSANIPNTGITGANLGASLTNNTGNGDGHRHNISDVDLGWDPKWVNCIEVQKVEVE